ncbi:YciI family protein [Sinomonas terrae]|uniref:YciI family protein n=1 Tax=Sinomonas terrae TaxID=2908838 RepID=A0ABS9U109_9MICC|nr:YciI family protein [Sinomonas terrae]MCH6470097.1 YciI family protein [Sinomonas terrae]
MAYFAVTYEYTDSSERRDQHRPEHVRFLAGLHEERRLLVSGPVDGGARALLVLAGESAEQVAGVLDGDPFHREGLIARRDITAWNVFFGADRLAAVTA